MKNDSYDLLGAERLESWLASERLALLPVPFMNNRGAA